MYGLKFSPKLGSAEITGSLDDCYALNFEKVGAGPQIDGLVYQHPPKQYLLDGLLPGKYRLSGVMQRQGDNVFVRRAEVTVKDGDRAIADMDAAALGTCSLHGKILGKLSKPRADLRGEFRWFVLIRKPDSPPVTTADAYEALTMDTIYVIRGRNIVRETEEQARYHLEEMAPGKYTATVIEHDLWGGAFITRQQSKPLTIKPNEEAVLDFDLEGTENQTGSLSIRAASADESQFVATLSNGVTVELVGLGPAPWESKQQWWKPDGTSMSKPTFKANQPPHRWPAGPNGLQFGGTALFRFSNHLRKDVSVAELKFKNRLLGSGLVSGIADDGTHITYIVYLPSEILPDSTDIKLAVCGGKSIQAERIEHYIPDQHQVYVLEDKSTVILHPLRTGKLGTLCVDLTCDNRNKDIEFRVKAKLGNGETERWYGGSVGKEVQFFQSTPKRRNVQVEDVEELIVEYRPYEWVEFKNVALRPGVKTSVETMVLAASPGRARLEKVNLKDVEVKNIIAKLREWTGKSIIAESDVLNQKITVFSADELTRSDALSVIYAALSQRGIVAEKKGDIIILRRAEDEYLRSVAAELGEQVTDGRSEVFDVESGSVIEAVGNKATLESGTIVELLGVTRVPVRDQPSWKPDGSFLEPMFDRVDYEPSDDPNSDKFEYYALPVRLENTPVDKLGLIKWRFDDAKGHPGSANAYLGRERLYEKGVIVGTVKFATIAAGRHWGVYQNGGDSIIIGNPQIGGGPGGVFGEPGVHTGVHIGVTYNITDRQFRVVAVDKEGKIHLSRWTGSGGTDNLRFTTGSFPNLERDQLEEYRFEVRPYEWVKFKDVSLRPGVRTDVKVGVPPPAAWRERFDEIYRLDDGQILRRIAPPFIPERAEYYRHKHSHQASAISEPPDFFTFHWDGALVNWGLGFTGGERPLDAVLRHNLSMGRDTFEGPEELLEIDVQGDWIVRKDSSVEQRLEALEKILEDETGREIRFVKRRVEREVIVAGGRYRFRGLPGKGRHGVVYMYSDIFDPDSGGGGGTAESVSEFLAALANRVGVPVIDRTESSGNNKIVYDHHRSSRLDRVTDELDRAKKLEMLLANLTKQTDLQFKISTEPVEIWFVTE
jgi:hypothetical protein